VTLVALPHQEAKSGGFSNFHLAALKTFSSLNHQKSSGGSITNSKLLSAISITSHQRSLHLQIVRITTASPTMSDTTPQEQPVESAEATQETQNGNTGPKSEQTDRKNQRGSYTNKRKFDASSLPETDDPKEIRQQVRFPSSQASGHCLTSL
jgi:hypothetical protein